MRKNVLSFGLILLIIAGCSPKNQVSQDDADIQKIIGQMTLDEKIEMIGGVNDFYIKGNKRLGLPEVKMSDATVGVRDGNPAIAYPATIAYAATWDTALIKKVGEAIASEAKSKNISIMLGPGMNIHRAPMCGRNFEYLGEDPFLAGKMATAFIKGMQSKGVVATAKHYAANNQDFSRHLVSSDLDERTLHEIYLPAFRASVQEGNVGAVMSAYNPVNGVYSSQNEYLLTEVLKKVWGFDGFVMSDWVSTYDGVGCAKAGLDIEMPSGAHMNKDSLLPAIKDGKLTEEMIDDKIRRILRIYKRFGMFDQTAYFAGNNFDTASARKIAIDVARGATTLLRNQDNFLPLKKETIKTIAVIGPNGHPAVTGGGGSSFVTAYQQTSFYEAIKKLAGDKISVSFERGTKLPRFIEPALYKNSRFYYIEGNEKIAGLKGEYFQNKDLEGTPFTTRTDVLVNFDKPGDVPAGLGFENVSARWTGLMKVEKTGTYDFTVSGDDGYRLWVNQKLVIDQWYDQPEMFKTVAVDLQKGNANEIALEYYQGGGGAAIRLGYELSNINKNDAVERAVALAAKSDLIVLCVGFDYKTESEGFDRPFNLPEEQELLINLILKANTNVIVLLSSGGNVEMQGWLAQTKALLHTWYPGQEGAVAVAEILFGDVNPSGKLPVSFEKRWEDNATFSSYFDDDKDKRVTYSEGIFVGYRHFDKNNIGPQFPFGFGLSYTTFSYQNLKLSNEQINAEDGLTVTFTVKNDGTRDGAEISQLYVSDPESSVPRPVKELKSFNKTYLKAGEAKEITMKINKDAFSFYDVATKKWIVEPGDFEILIGSSSRDIRLKAQVKVIE